MKKFLSVILLFTVSELYGQTGKGTVFLLDHLPATVSNQWKFHAGDNAAWLDTAFDDHNWQHLDLTQKQHFLPQVSNAQIAWFRLSVNVAPALRGKAVALVVNQSGASEIYFNGVLIRSNGRLNINGAGASGRRSVREPLVLQLTDAPRQYIAIRYSPDQSNLLIGNGYHVISATFKQVDSGWDDFFLKIDAYTSRAFVTGCFALLAILQLTIYLFNRERKVNLYLSIYAFFQAVTLSDGLTLPLFQSTNWSVINLSIFNITAPLCLAFLMLMAYTFFEHRKTRWFIVLAVLCTLIIILQFVGDNAENEYVLAVYNTLCIIEIIRISVIALRQKKSGAALFLAGIIISLVFFVLFNITPFISQSWPLNINFEVAVAFLTPAIIFSILLAREFAQNLISLRQKLAEVETLSAMSLRQEVEKQHILSKQNEMLEQKVSERTAELNQLINDLKATQTQLIQSEKMASLGELTAGIAHEIQNPLNFVNNFSDVNSEMIDELKEELQNGNIEEAIAIANDIQQNEEKIKHHGKRADFIVKGMLQHSRTSTGEKQLTNINLLADEFLKLSYHGLRAKDKTFNAELVTNFDETLPKVNVSQQDIGRVLLNLFNNAFYAVHQKARTVKIDYKPTVEVSTFSKNGNIEIRVKDNGNGIPDAIKDKIMQPFFTTKPTGEGTGLGLSLSYDIVVKGHGGNIDVHSKENEYTKFKITLPL